MANALGTAIAFGSNANSATNSSYTSMGVVDFTSAPPHECLIEVSLQATGTPASTSQCVLYLRSSLDGTNFSVAPSSTDAVNAKFLGTVSLPDTTARRSVAFPVSPLFGGALPQKIELYVYNNTGAALAATGQTAQYRTETFG
jgi:hypothetical protein